jgi:preprotein translocase subunit SecF
VAPRTERKRPANATASDVVPDADVPALASTAPRPGSRPTAKRNTNRGGRSGGNRPSGGAKRR